MSFETGYAHFICSEHGYEMEEAFMKIGEIAGFFGVSVKAIRVYEKKGILTPAKVDSETGYRYYSADQVHRLNALLELKQLGFTLVEVKHLLEAGISSEEFVEAIAHKKLLWEGQIAKAQNKIQAIDTITERLKTAEPLLKTYTLSDEEWAWSLVKMVCVEDLHGQHVLSEAVWL